MAFHSGAQEPWGMQESDLKGITVKRVADFDGSSLWGYMNGGADLYIEYGFVWLRMQEISYRGIPLKMELFRMSDPLAAFGIFSVLRFRCSLPDDLPVHTCVTPYQVLFCKGPYLLSVVNEDGAAKSLEACLDISVFLAGRIREDGYIEPVHLGSHISQDETENIRLARGRLGVQNGMPLLEPLLDDDAGYTICYISLERDAFSGFIAWISPDDGAMTEKVMERAAGQSMEAARIGASSCLVYRMKGDQDSIRRWIDSITNTMMKSGHRDGK